MSKIYKAVAYLRISNADSNLGESESLTHQRQFIQDFVSKQSDIELVCEKLDDGVSGLVFDRPQFKEMMEEVMKGAVDCVIVKDLSRFGRDYVQTGEHLRKIFPSMGVRFISVLENIDTKNDGDLSGKLDVTLRTILNDNYSHDISKKTRSALKIIRQNGGYTGACPIYGYQKAVDNKNQLVIDENTADVVRKIFALKKEGYGSSKIANVLNSRGVLSPLEYKKSNGLPTPKGGFADKEHSLWSASTILRILKDETYTGTLVQGKETTYNYKLKEKMTRAKEDWAIVENAHEPIVSKEDFLLVQKLMNLDTRTSPAKENVYLFSGLLICGCCGSRMVRKTVPSNKKKYVYYSCNTGRKNGCTTKMIKEEVLTSIVDKSIRSFVGNVVELEQVLQKIDNTSLRETKVRQISRKLTSVQEEIKKVDNFKYTLYANLTEEILTKDEYKDFLNQYNSQLEVLKATEQQLKEDLQENSFNLDELYWVQSLKAVETQAELDRLTVVELLTSITVGEQVHLSFRCQDEFNILLSLLDDKEVG